LKATRGKSPSVFKKYGSSKDGSMQGAGEEARQGKKKEYQDLKRLKDKR